MSPDQANFRHDVARVALELFAKAGFEATSVEQIAAAAGISRSTFFRQFRSKDDVLFADHDTILASVKEFLAQPHEDPWLAVCQSAELVFGYFAKEQALAAQRYAVVSTSEVLRDRELVTVFRYEKLFEAYLSKALPGLEPLDSVRFAASVTATHNYLLREMMRSSAAISTADVLAALDDVRRLFGVLPGSGKPATDDDVVVAVFSRTTPAAAITRAIASQLTGRQTH